MNQELTIKAGKRADSRGFWIELDGLTHKQMIDVLEHIRELLLNELEKLTAERPE